MPASAQPDSGGNNSVGRSVNAAIKASWAAVATAALPRGTSLDYAKELHLGLCEAGEAFGCPVVGGDTATWDGKLVLTVTNPDSGSATEELEVEYDSDPLDIGFNSRYLLDITSQIEGDVAVLKLADPGSPTLIQEKDSTSALYVLMPMRV